MVTGVAIQELPPALGERTIPLWSDLLLEWADRRRRWLLGAVLVVYLAGMNGQWRMEPDSALYLTLARHVAAGHGYIYHGKPSPAGYPGLPYALSVVFRLLPASHEDALNLVTENLLMHLAALATLALTYRLIRLSAGRPTAVLVTCGVGLTRTFYRAAFALMTDMPFLLGVMAFLAGYEGLRQRGKRPWLDVALMLGGAVITISTRPAWLAFAAAVAAALIVAGVRRRLSWKTVIASLAAAVIAAIAFYAADPRVGAGRYEDQFLDQFRPAQWTAMAATAAANTWDILRETATSAMLGIKFGPAPDAPGARHWYEVLCAAMDVIYAAATLAMGVCLLRRRALWGLWVAATILMMILVLPHERYFLQVLPLLIFAWFSGALWLNRRMANDAGNIIFALLLGLVFVPNMLHVMGMVIEQHRRPFLAHYHDGKYEPIVAAAGPIAQTPVNAVILAPKTSARILTYLSRRTVVESNDLMSDVGWPISDRPVYILNNPDDDEFQAWLAGLGITDTAPAEEKSDPGMGPLRLERVLPIEQPPR
jgi:hypothetical protein